MEQFISQGPDPVDQVAEAIAGLEFEALPPATVRGACDLVLDSLAVAIAGRGLPEVEILVRLAVRWGGLPESAIIGADHRVPAPTAALVNGTMIQALDFDDTHDPSGAHIASTVLAAALAVADVRGCSGADLIAALVAGVELTGRLGVACHEKIGWTSTAVYGTFGAAAAAAHLLGLDQRQTRHALGIAVSQVAGTSQTAIDAPLSKHMQSGFAAKAGVLSALLAAEGTTGVEHVFEGQFGFFALYKGGRYRIDPLIAQWEPPFVIETLSYKPFPSCRATHGPIEAALAIASIERIDIDDIAEVEVTIPQIAWDLTGRPFVTGENPVVSAQFSTPYTVATALLDGTVALRHLTIDAVRNASVRRLANAVRVRVAESEDFFVPARVDVRTRDGHTLSHTVRSLKGGPDRRMTEKEVTDKVRDCLAFAPPGAAEVCPMELQSRVHRLAEIDRGKGGLVRALTGGNT